MKGKTRVRNERFANGNSIFRLEGNAKFTFPSGTTYVGEFKDGEFHGHGILHYGNGAKYEATWENGVAKEVSNSCFIHWIIFNRWLSRVSIRFPMV